MTDSYRLRDLAFANLIEGVPMLVLGLLLMVLAALAMVGVIVDGGESANLELFGQSFDTTVAGLFIAGAVSMLVFLLGAWMLTAGMGRARRKRTERKQAKREYRDSVERLESERAQLREENERLSRELHSPSREQHGTTGAAAGSGAAAGAGAGAAGGSLTGATHPGDSTGLFADDRTVNDSSTDSATRSGTDSGENRVVDARSDRIDQHSGPSGGGSHRVDPH
jgi:hypothetical protein